jgi:ABC-type branched-subunit amino acid transport system ATPase component
VTSYLSKSFGGVKATKASLGTNGRSGAFMPVPLLEQVDVQRIGELLSQLRGTGATELIAEPNMHFCLGLASHATVIDKGQIVYTSGIEEPKANENIRQRYLAL